MLLETIAVHLKKALAGIHDPITQECPKVVVRGSSLDNLAIDIEGSDAIVAEGRERPQNNFDETTNNSCESTIHAQPNQDETELDDEV